MRILLTNDDGIDAPGLVALYQAICSLGDVHVVAPADIQSAASHAVTIHKPVLTRRHVCVCEGKCLFEGTAVDGRPADCVKLALSYVVPGPVDLVVSGMNCGANVGINVIYSGTVAAAMEAGFMGVPAIAVSLHIGDVGKTRWAAAAAHARRVIDVLLAGPLVPHTVLNVNIPILDDGDSPQGVRVVPVSTSPLLERYHSELHPTGDKSYQASPDFTFKHTPADSDVDALFRRFITVTPLQFDMTDHRRLGAWQQHLDKA